MLSLGTFAFAQVTNAPASAPAEPTFNVLKYRVESNTVLATERIERAVYPYLGERRTVADVESAPVALATAYREGLRVHTSALFGF